LVLKNNWGKSLPVKRGGKKKKGKSAAVATIPGNAGRQRQKVEKGLTQGEEWGFRHPVVFADTRLKK